MLDRRSLCGLACLAGGLGCAGGAAAQASQAVPVTDISDQAQSTKVENQQHGDAQKAQLLVVPIPQSNPAVGAGVTLAGVLFYNPNNAPQPWVSGLGATYTSNHSWAVGGFHSMSLKQDRFRILGIAGYADVNVKFYGIGPTAGDRNRFIKVEDKALIVALNGQMRFAKSLYAGARYVFLDLKSSIRVSDPELPDLAPPLPELESRISALGPMITYDSRDQPLNPRRGEYAVLSWLFNSPSIGSDFKHDKLQLQANLYRPLGRTTTVAARVSACGVSTGAPFYDLCMYGLSNDLRGYETGRYRDRANWALQAELRQHLFGRFSAVAFAGVGGTAPSLGKLDQTKFLPAGGAGLRYLASRKNNVNLRVDFVVGRHSNAFYFGIGEAF